MQRNSVRTLVKSLTVKVWLALLVCILCTTGCSNTSKNEVVEETKQNKIELTEDSTCYFGTEKQIDNMQQHGTGVILTIGDSDASKDVFEMVENQAKEIDVPVLIVCDHSENETDHILFVKSGDVLKEMDDFENESEIVANLLTIKQAREANDQRGCGEYCNFGK